MKQLALRLLGLSRDDVKRASQALWYHQHYLASFDVEGAQPWKATYRVFKEFSDELECR